MKKIFVLLAVLLAGVQGAFAQPFWHSDLGNAPTGTVRLSSDAQTYSFETTHGVETGYDASAILSSLNRQLTASGFTWIAVSAIESQTVTQFVVTLRLSRNTGTSPRSVYFGTNSRRLEILQQAVLGNPEPDLPTDRVVRVYPGCREILTIPDTNLGQIYSLKTQQADDEITLTSITGTGGSVSFNERLLPGSYWIENARNSSFTVEYAYPFTLRLDTDIEECSMDADGGVQYVHFSMGWEPDFTELPFSSDEDIHFFEEPFDLYNGGHSENWNPHMKIYYGYDNVAQMCFVRVVCPPNLSPEPIVSDSFLCNGNMTHITFQQAAYGHVSAVHTNIHPDRHASKLDVDIDAPQPFVTYSIYKEGTRLVSKTAFVDALTLTAALSAGSYEVRAEYEDEAGRYEFKVLKAVSFYGDCLAELSDTQNWILSQTFNEEGKHAYDLTYYDGLGYASQEIAVGAVENGASDLIRPIVYDALHREAYRYLPYASRGNFGKYADNARSAQSAFYVMKYGNAGGSVFPYAYDQYESSPLNRVLRSHKPGPEYQADEHTLRNAYSGNDPLSVLRLDIDPATRALHVNGHYAVDMLSAVRTTDEDGAVSIFYTDKEGRTVYEERQLRKANNSVARIGTCYVYDDCGRLAWVVTPEGVDRLVQGRSYAATDDFAKRYCYVYRYDELSRMVEKRMPGRDAEYIVYDRGDRPAMQQDGNLRTKKQWLIFRYDAFGRVTEQLLAGDSTAPQTPEQRAALQASFDTGTAPDLYDSAAATLVYRHVYDKHPALLRPTLVFVNVASLATIKDDRTVGMPVYEKLAVLSENGIDGYRERVFYYDSKGRVIQRVECDEDGNNLLRISNKYDFVGNIVAQRESYTYGGKTDDLDRTFSYDTRNRLVKETARLNGGELAEVNHTYDDLGQLTGKTYGTGVHAIHETMDYNIQGWLTEKSSELFEMNLRYFDPRRDWVAASYTGNIAEWKWQHKQVDGATPCEDFTYAYVYDDLGRLQNADLYTRDDDTLDGFVSGLSERMSYDRNSNILTLNRQGSPGGNEQSYGFEYTGNQRTKELNSNNAYAYDANGNMTEDALTGFGMSYNMLNLPEYIQDNWGSGEISHRYSYLADGTKKTVGDYENSGYLYAGSLAYSTDYGTMNSFESASFGGGRIVGTNNGSEVHYFLTDHLGSTRVVAKVTPSGREDLDRKDYYPFGKAWTQPDMPTSDNRYTFSGKELQQAGTSSAHYADFGARFYDSDGVMFLQQDPLLEKYVSIGQYNYCAGNPIRFSDKKGESIKDAVVGYAVGFVTNVVPGTTSLRESYTPTDAGDYNNALQTSDAIAGLTGTALSDAGDGLIATGTGVAATAATVTVATAGASGEVTVPLTAAGKTAALAGLGMKAVGVALMGNSGKNAAKGYEYGNSQPKKTNPKKEARERGKEKRANQPASEDYAKYKAKRLEGKSGKDARREAHDAKDTGGRDRTKSELDEDYR